MRIILYNYFSESYDAAHKQLNNATVTSDLSSTESRRQRVVPLKTALEMPSHPLAENHGTVLDADASINAVENREVVIEVVRAESFETNVEENSNDSTIIINIYIRQYLYF